MFYEGTAKQLMDALPSEKRPMWRPRTRWWNCAEDLARLVLGFTLEKLLLAAKDSNAWRL